ncbi:Dol-P-Glc:Glc(2)Man(9)GlcNAc(2)-PP-Dol alpha-1,2-glucosyltransferase [Neurospora hispaniola]|uniref:Dol-P-Glc:Glc(2)Man(9)GlcNAc(2)-PP-Dol alpha-1,2-glucosyltransferase n=1 Tax=Neurospora hispaniola TaxID=588809 RepID=A0AAJ0MMI0_9PEZI|nr:Dol-P-Glc:Glc(2)Man(9)GlcNAc(2)-PP-Dol alpha-1,2-glucosyltransferase [Neurospora hispaniola]
MMDALRVLLETSTFNEVLRGLAISILLAKLTQSTISSSKSQGSTFITASGFILIYFFARAWLALVNHYAPEPYLDEVFHIPQAQTYCEGRYHEWDNKITTPPGLYLLSVGWHKLMRLAECTPSSLRSNNLVATLLIALLALSCRRRIEAQTAVGTEKSAVSLYAYHTAINIALFPVIFFFSGLYYTDVASTLVMLVAYRNHLNRVASHSQKPGFLNGLWTVILGVAALFMRQTNVFWVVVYMGGLEAAHVVKGLKPKPVSKNDTPDFVLENIRDSFGFWLRRYAVGDVHDPPVDMAWPDDWALCLLSIGIAALCNPLRVLRQVWPHITIMGLFAGFVAWNGGVVLGDKSNHIATIHLPQMLYIWPFFAFFSAPLLIPCVLSTLAGQITRTKSTTPSHTTTKDPGRSSWRSTKPLIKSKKSSTTKPPQKSGPTPASSSFSPDTNSSGRGFRFILDLVLSRKLYYPFYLLTTLLLSAAIIRYNTIIHPFTLADNRHYMFYIFRYTILRSSLVRLALVAAYTLSRWLIWKRLEGNNPPLRDLGGETGLKITENKLKWRDEFSASPFVTQDFYGPKTINNDEQKNIKAKQKEEEEEEEDWLVGGAYTTLSPSSTQPSPATSSPPTSTVLLWLLTTTLSLVTAPLVEPRYFILPWVFYRLLVPAMPLSSSLISSGSSSSFASSTTDSGNGDGNAAATAVRQQQNGNGKRGLLWNIIRRTDASLALETAWFLAINIGTMYMFLFKPFYWKTASGEMLDGGRLQRFMW